MTDRSEIWFATSSDKGHTWSEPRFLYANAGAPDRGSPFGNHSCSYLDALVDDGTIHLFGPHRWQQAVHLRIKEADLPRCKTRQELALG